MPRRASLRAGPILAPALLLTACSTPVPVPNVTPEGPARHTCLRLADRLPDRVGDGERRDTRPGGPFSAAWGDPPIVLRCGVTAPAALSPTSELVSVNRVDWFAERLPRGYRFTTVGLPARIEVRVPAAYAPEVNPLVDLAPAIRSASGG